VPIQQRDNLQRPRYRASRRILHLQQRLRGGGVQFVRAQFLWLSELHILQRHNHVQWQWELLQHRQLRLQLRFWRSGLQYLHAELLQLSRLYVLRLSDNLQW
jgi:hypothetical protein